MINVSTNNEKNVQRIYIHLKLKVLFNFKQLLFLVYLMYFYWKPFVNYALNLYNTAFSLLMSLTDWYITLFSYESFYVNIVIHMYIYIDIGNTSYTYVFVSTITNNIGTAAIPQFR